MEMDVPFDTQGDDVTLDLAADDMQDQAELDDPRIEEASSEYLVSWNRLISTTNWDKGRIIFEWREALVAVDAPASAYSDEAWSRRVGNVSPQHVGRLRRVYDRFHETYRDYDGLYWSHFQAALDWEDAEMWLEGAVQDQWSVATMRGKRWETLGAPADKKPRDEDIILSEPDEDVEVLGDVPKTISEVQDQVRPSRDDSKATDEPDEFDEPVDAVPMDVPSAPAVEPVRPFEDLPELPDDLADAVESLKLAILHHKLDGWRDVRCDDVLATLNALKHLALTTE
ncbi:MAG: hypothetical protein JW818_03350 [Pirellulales bacterium]|nr:hypothetical protein [Pirellulales bacterium]